MSKKIIVAAAILGAVSALAFGGVGVWKAQSAAPAFQAGGYILQDGQDAVKYLPFEEGDTYSPNLYGGISFKSAGSGRAAVPRESFAHLDNGSVMALSGGILLDFSDLSENFINNYYISAGLPIMETGGGYAAATNAGTIKFGEHLWKLSESKYLVEAPELKVHFAEDDVREAGRYVQVAVTQDQIVHLITPENLWITISDSCYIETGDGVRIYPVRQLVDDGKYKISTAKLSVDPDDAIVLTEDETRRQIVPQLNIDTVDGEDGEDGEDGRTGRSGDAGESGRAGSDGSDGLAGQTGEKGADGSQGTAGRAGKSGKKGTSGSAGAAGENGEGGIKGVPGAEGTAGQDGGEGEKGADGEKGQEGREGGEGAEGQAGASGGEGRKGAEGDKGAQGQAGIGGGDGVQGEPGAAGQAGTGGRRGGTGASGKDAVVESTVNSALPVMAITDWQVSAAALRGTIAVGDAGGFLNAISELDDYKLKYPGAVTIVKTGTGETIKCYRTDENYFLIESSADPLFTDFYTGTEEVCFSTLDGALEPDTEYRLSVTAYYKTADQSDLIYSREFISRAFYTDSTGVILSKEKASQQSLTVSASVSDSYKDSVDKAEVYLLTPAQNEVFNAASVRSGDASKYTYKVKVDFQSGNTQQAYFSPLTPDTEYIARVYVTTNAGLETLTGQELRMMTLKRSPSWNGAPRAAYNRATGAFEVWRPAVGDPDAGAVSYTYAAQRMNDEGEWEEAASRTVPAAAGEPAEFRLNSGEYFRFGVEMKFNDNEKAVIYDLGYCDPVRAEGDTMPKIVLIPDEGGTEYNRYAGKLKISLGPHSSLTAEPGKPLKLEFYADQIQNSSVELTADSEPVNVNGTDAALGQATLDPAVNTNERTVSLDLRNLYKNTNYSITVYGWLDVGDGNGPVSRAVGTVSFRTYDTLAVNAVYSTPLSFSTAFARTLVLQVQSPQGAPAPEERTAYADGQLRGGRVTVELYSGTGTGKLRIAQKNFSGGEDLGALYSPGGREITEADFGSPRLDPTGNYTLSVSSVADGSCELDLGYVNEFEPVLNASEVVSAEPTPPDLLKDPSKGVSAVAILNSEAEFYGGTPNKDLPDGAIVGYALEAAYDNVQRIGREITYYAFEYNTFFNALANEDPLTVAKPLMKMTQEIDAGSDRVPKTAVLFGGEKPTPDGESKYMNGFQVYRAGEPDVQSGSLISGMGRGFRYIFAYTVKYAGGGGSASERVYPYGHREFSQYKLYYGGVKENDVQIGKGVAYVLNSGMREAPYIMPDFHTYVEKSNPVQLLKHDDVIATGNVTLRYAWRDPDRLITTDDPKGNDTLIYYKTGLGEASQKINEKPIDAGDPRWYKIELPYSVSRTEKQLVEPEADICEYRINYNATLEKFDLRKDRRRNPLAVIPVEWPWESQFEQDRYKGQVIVTMEPHFKENYIAFRLAEPEDSVPSQLISRAAAMRLKFSLKLGGSPKTFTLPLTRDPLGPYARLATGRLGTEYLGKEFEVQEALILFDSGEQGWNCAQKDEDFALQYINAPGGFGFSDYAGVYSDRHMPANGAVLSIDSDFDCAKLRGAVGKTPKEDKKIRLSTGMLAGSGFYAFLYPDNMGADAHNNSSPETRSGRYLVPKKLAKYELTLDLASVGDHTLTEITPTMEHAGFSTSAEAVGVQGLKVAGFKNGGKVYMVAYGSYDDAKALNEQFKGGRVEIVINDDGTPQTAVPTITGLEKQTYYYIAFYYKPNEGENVLLLCSDTTEAAVYGVTTSKDAEIDITNIYRNDSYFDKSLEAEFGISRVFNLKLRYDILDSAGENTVLTYEEMKDSGMLTEPQVLDRGGNRLRINLEPNVRRGKLKPGAAYRLRIRADELSGQQAGCAEEPFTITAVGNYGALIFVSSATSDSISYQVTINDPQYSFMTVDSNEGRTAGGLYAVRFTDKEGRLLHTAYDGEVFKMTDLKKEFILNDETLMNDELHLETNKTMEKDSEYRLNIYAVPDSDHDGQILFDGEVMTWKDFFEEKSGSIDGSKGEKLNKIIDGFWNTDTTDNAGRDEAERLLLVAEKRQKTTDETNWLLNEKSIYSVRKDPNTVRIIFYESFGLIKDEGGTQEPVFKRIDWSADGHMNDSRGTPVSGSGTSLYSKLENLLKPGTDAAGYSIYYYDIPYTLGQGTYVIVLQFREGESEPAPAKAVTLNSGV